MSGSSCLSSTCQHDKLQDMQGSCIVCCFAPMTGYVSVGSFGRWRLGVAFCSSVACQYRCKCTCGYSCQVGCPSLVITGLSCRLNTSQAQHIAAAHASFSLLSIASHYCRMRVQPDLMGGTQRCLNLGSYNYLGFAAADEYCTPRVLDSLADWGVSTCSSRTEAGAWVA
jgi:hypothetical protein